MSEFKQGVRVAFHSDGGAVDTGTIEKVFCNWGSEEINYEVLADRGSTFVLLPHNMTALDSITPRELELREAVKGKLMAEGMSIESDWSRIEACLSKTVAPELCIRIAKRMRGLEVVNE